MRKQQMMHNTTGIIDLRPLWRKFIAITVMGSTKQNNPGRGGTGGREIKNTAKTTTALRNVS